MFHRTTTKKKGSDTSDTTGSSTNQPANTKKSLIATSNYAARCKVLMDVHRELMTISGGLPFELPRVVVVGGQSSGKSSLVEAVSGITVPRDSGTCTRCPMICTLSTSADKWSCTIQLCFEYDPRGIQNESFTGPVQFGGIIRDKSSVELWIRRAQAAILSPHRNPSHFLAMSKADLKALAETDPDMLPFSRNSVKVNVCDPAATDVSFVDLPGLIQNADEELITLVRSLVESYMAGQNTIIVIAMPMTDDVEMIQGLTLAKVADPGQERTIGVMTKPDAITKGAKGGREKWKAILEGRDHRTKHGYFCVRLPDEDERARAISVREAQRLSTAFFDSTEPWSGMQEQSRFGVPAFVACISELLADLLERNLQALKDVVDSELELCLRELAALPPQLTDEPSAEIVTRINLFCRDLLAAIHGKDAKHFVQRNIMRYNKFKSDIQKTTPDFRPVEDINHHRSSPFVVSEMEPRGLPYVREAIGKAITWELFGVPFEVIQTLVTEYTNRWSEPSYSCFEDTYHHLQTFSDELVQEHFGQYPVLTDYVSGITLKEISDSRSDARRLLGKVLAFETSPIFTLHRDALTAEKSRWLQIYSHSQLSIADRNSPISLRHTFPNGQRDIVVDTMPRWGINDELEVMASVQAYFQVAYKRFVDNVPLLIEHELHQALGLRIEHALLNRFFQEKPDGQVDVHDLLRENPQLEAKRNSLNAREKCLRRIKAKLDLLEPRDTPPSALDHQ